MKLKTLNLSTTSEKEYDTLEDTFVKSKDNYQLLCTLPMAVQNKSLIKTNDAQFFFIGSDLYIIKENRICKVNVNDSYTNTPFSYNEKTDYEWFGIVIKHKNKSLVLLNADADDDNNDFELIDYCNKCGIFHVIFSFSCLSKLARPDKAELQEFIFQEFLEKDSPFKIVDFSGGGSIPLTADERKKLKALFKSKKSLGLLKGPVGYTLVGHKWHKSPTTLISDKKTNKTYLLGQDENQYFGCELVDHPKTIEKAFVSLMPPIARTTHHERQGEWFLIPWENDDLPEVKDRVLELENVIQEISTNNQIFALRTAISLNRDDPNSNKHCIRANEIIVDNQNRVFAFNPTLVHQADQHADVTMKGWVLFARNTATRSVSVDGVD